MRKFLAALTLLVFCASITLMVVVSPTNPLSQHLGIIVPHKPAATEPPVQMESVPEAEPTVTEAPTTEAPTEAPTEKKEKPTKAPTPTTDVEDSAEVPQDDEPADRRWLLWIPAGLAVLFVLDRIYQAVLRKKRRKQRRRPRMVHHK